MNFEIPNNKTKQCIQEFARYDKELKILIKLVGLGKHFSAVMKYTNCIAVTESFFRSFLKFLQYSMVKL